ncbi:MAG TPA: DUF6547 family protein [Polyangiaceae bacterium]|nr:DUF6547 family protein [Polyangiaceae bacterium]
MERKPKKYRDFIDEMVDVCHNGQGQVGPDNVRKGVWNRSANAADPSLRTEHEINALLARLTPAERQLIAKMLEQATSGGVFETLKALELFGIEPFVDGYEGSPFHDFVGRMAKDWDWPDQSDGDGGRMRQFPDFMKSAANRIASTAEHTTGVDGYVFDGADGTQVAFWECRADANTEEHVHEFDEYLLVVEGCYSLTLDGKEIQLIAGQEGVIPRGTRISGSVLAGTRTIHMFGGRRVSNRSS